MLGFLDLPTQVQDEYLEFEAPLPEDFEQLLAEVEK